MGCLKSATSRCWQGCACSAPSCLFQLPAAPGVSWRVEAELRAIFPLPPQCLPSSVRTPVTLNLSPTRRSYFPLMTSTKTLSLNQVIFQVPGFRSSTHIHGYRSRRVAGGRGTIPPRTLTYNILLSESPLFSNKVNVTIHLGLINEGQGDPPVPPYFTSWHQMKIRIPLLHWKRRGEILNLLHLQTDCPPT